MFVLARVLHALKNASAYFQRTISLLLDSRQHSFEAWIGDSTVYTAVESELLKRLEELFAIYNKHNFRLFAKDSGV